MHMYSVCSGIFVTVAVGMCRTLILWRYKRLANAICKKFTRQIGQEPFEGFVFPGQGSQMVGMCADLVQNFPESKAILEEVC